MNNDIGQVQEIFIVESVYIYSYFPLNTDGRNSMRNKGGCGEPAGLNAFFLYAKSYIILLNPG